MSLYKKCLSFLYGVYRCKYGFLLIYWYNFIMKLINIGMNTDVFQETIYLAVAIMFIPFIILVRGFFYDMDKVLESVMKEWIV